MDINKRALILYNNLKKNLFLENWLTSRWFCRHFKFFYFTYLQNIITEHNECTLFPYTCNDSNPFKGLVLDSGSLIPCKALKSSLKWERDLVSGSSYRPTAVYLKYVYVLLISISSLNMLIIHSSWPTSQRRICVGDVEIEYVPEYVYLG